MRIYSERRLYQGIIVSLFALLALVVIVSSKNYLKLIEINEQTHQLMDEQEKVYEAQLADWKEAYSVLQQKYEESLASVIENEVPTSKSSTYNFTEDEIMLLAKCVRAEAGNYKQHANSQRYVAQVILNRLHSDDFPNTISEIIYQKSAKGIPQFSVAYNGMIDDAVVTEETLANVKSVINQGTDLPSYVCYFYSEKVTGNWVNNLTVYTTVEGTVFAYSEEDKNE